MAPVWIQRWQRLLTLQSLLSAQWKSHRHYQRSGFQPHDSSTSSFSAFNPPTSAIALHRVPLYTI
eukprot:3709732-Amphidinium_carterae.1